MKTQMRIQLSFAVVLGRLCGIDSSEGRMSLRLQEPQRLCDQDCIPRVFFCFTHKNRPLIGPICI